MPIYRVARKKPLKLHVLNIVFNKKVESQIAKDIKNRLRCDWQHSANIRGYAAKQNKIKNKNTVTAEKEIIAIIKFACI